MRATWFALATSLLCIAPADGPPREAPKPTATPRVGNEAPVVLGLLSDADTAAVRPLTWAGRYTLLAFWSPDDPAAVRQLDELRRLYRDFAGDERFRIVGVATVPTRRVPERDDWDTWIEFMGRQPDVIGPDGVPRRFHLAWRQLFEAEAFAPEVFPSDDRGLTTAGRYGVAAPPAAFLIDPDGRLAAVRIPTEGLREAVAKVLSGGR